MEILWEILGRLVDPLIVLVLKTTLVVGIGFSLFAFFNADFLKDGLVWLVKRIDLFINGPSHRA